jgi:hypothetical protein
MKMWPLIAGAGSAALLVGLVLFEFTGGASASAPTVSDLTQVALTVSARNGVTAPNQHRVRNYNAQSCEPPASWGFC